MEAMTKYTITFPPRFSQEELSSHDVSTKVVWGDGDWLERLFRIPRTESSCRDGTSWYDRNTGGILCYFDEYGWPSRNLQAGFMLAVLSWAQEFFSTYGSGYSKVIAELHERVVELWERVLAGDEPSAAEWEALHKPASKARRGETRSNAFWVFVATMSRMLMLCTLNKNTEESSSRDKSPLPISSAFLFEFGRSRGFNGVVRDFLRKSFQEEGGSNDEG